MFKINRLRLEIQSTEFPEDNKYGFDIPFRSGLNVIAGHNSKGKSTIGSSIYYALGMEELLGAKNEMALGKALKTEFDIFDSRVNSLKSFRILYSKVFIEIENEKGEIVTIRRYINSNQKDQNQNDKNTKKVLAYLSKFEDIDKDVKSYPLFLRNDNNNSDQYGFYHWLADFIGIQIPQVLNNKMGYSPLYLQTIFASFLIEQTKGWTDFLATIPYFGIPKNKEKVIEFILDLNELSVSSKRDKIEKEENLIKTNWGKTISKLEILANEYGGTLKFLPETATAEQDAFNLTTIFLNDENDNTEKSIKSLRQTYSENLNQLRNTPIKKVGENKDFIRQKLEKLYEEQSSFMVQFEEFDLQLNLQKNQLENISKHYQNITKELSSQKGIQNIIEESILVSDVYDKCPTCTQTVSDDLLLAEGITIEKLSLSQNIAYLSGQHKIIKRSIETLTNVIDEKKIIRKYYIKKQREFEEEIKLILQELITDDRDYSDVDTLHRVRLEKKISDFITIDEIFNSYITILKVISLEYSNLLQEKLLLEGSSVEDNLKLTSLEKVFKTDFLFPFKYSSNKNYNVYIQKNQPFKYFPVFKYTELDELPQSIKTNSSASDFVRTIWAYSLSLLTRGKNHPGILILDEPGQHSVSSESLQALFEKCSTIKNRQTIIFTSIQKVLIKDGEKEIDALDLDSLLVNLVEDDYNLYKLPEIGKSIQLLPT
ncbi:hypothetical protein Flavo103_07760 [Flavobacterium collinsii]|uniref:AAA family ATPase n=1 Tax=Flavobacterium collinsii TaxID=1114861 RepID=UPI0022C00AF3|nr:AAA family ATPase [Flavobacterium collinsii]GIQ57640.1 hypothetical protein Flavo103_07760 [Flavobacterium collinsii]